VAGFRDSRPDKEQNDSEQTGNLIGKAASSIPACPTT
jgi:hypothetical protein